VVIFTECDQLVCNPPESYQFLYVCIYDSNIPKINHKTTEVYFFFLLIITVSGTTESNIPNVGENALCALGDSCEETAATRSLNNTEFHLRVLETDILDQDLEPFIDDTPGSDDAM
jgi:hypothetical protein